jgi:hypothetical protein
MAYGNDIDDIDDAPDEEMDDMEVETIVQNTQDPNNPVFS